MDFAAYDFWIKPIGLLLIGGVLQENGYDVELFDCLDRNHPALLRFQGLSQARNRADGTGRFYKEIIGKPRTVSKIPRRYGRYGVPYSIAAAEIAKLSSPKVIFITSGMTYWYPGVVEMISLLKVTFKNVPIILGGVYATLCPEHAGKFSGADRIVIGEGEREALTIADEMTGNRSDLERYQSMDDFPGPLYALYRRLDSAALLTSRGCPYRCPFCASHLLSPKFQRRSWIHVVDEIERLVRQKGVREFAFYDDALLYEKEAHLIPMLQEIMNRGMDVHFHTPNGIQPKEVDETTAQLMKKSGFRTVRLSYESSSRDRQERMGFKVKDDDVIRALTYLVNAGFQPRDIGCYVLVGLPGQELEEAAESMVFVLRLGMKVSLASFSPIPGTPCWQEAVNSGSMAPDADPLLTNNSIFPLAQGSTNYKNLLTLGTLAATANRMLNRGEDPLGSPAFVDPLKKLVKNAKKSLLSKIGNHNFLHMLSIKRS